MSPRRKVARKRAKAPGPREAKLARWVDLLAALLSRTFPAPFAELANDVPAYFNWESDKATTMRMFERDKDDLRLAGIPIETVVFKDGVSTGYRLRRGKFYLPYLDLLGAPRATRVQQSDYASLIPLSVSPEEVDLLTSAARRAEQLGGMVARDAQSVVEKLSVDLPAVADRSKPDARITSDDQSTPETLETVADAVRRRKRLDIQYGPLAPTDEHSRKGIRRVEGYGLFFLSGHWYLAARDIDRDALRNFRMSRLRVTKVNQGRAQTPDYEIPADFDLRVHAKGRQAWELGDAQDSEVIVEILRPTAEALAAAKLGSAVGADSSRRRFLVRRHDVFARWLLSLAGDVRPVAPAEFVERWRTLANETLALYATR